MKLKIIILIFLNFFFFQISIASNIAYIDLNYIINNSNSGKIISDKLEDINIKNLNLLKKEQSSLNNEKTEIEKTKNILSNDELNKKINILNDKLEKFNQKQKVMSAEFKELRNNEIANFLKKINPIIETFMIDNKIDLILKKESIYISKTEYDITNKLITLINKNIDK
jgi:outer membrane protein